MRVLVTGTRSRSYPESGVRAAFDLVQQTLKAVGDVGGPVVIVHGKCVSGVDDMAERLTPEYGWITEPHPAVWPECSPLCEGLPPTHRRVRGGNSYCSLAGFWRNQQMVNCHYRRPYRLCVALPWKTWQASPGTFDCYNRARRAGIETIALDDRGEFFVNPRPARKGLQ